MGFTVGLTVCLTVSTGSGVGLFVSAAVGADVKEVVGVEEPNVLDVGFAVTGATSLINLGGVALLSGSLNADALLSSLLSAATSFCIACSCNGIGDTVPTSCSVVDSITIISIGATAAFSVTSGTLVSSVTVRQAKAVVAIRIIITKRIAVFFIVFSFLFHHVGHIGSSFGFM